MKLHDITAEVLREAVRLYLEEAYKEAEVPAAVKSRLQWPDGADLASIAAGEAFETSPGDVPLEWCERVRLRLGNEGYPFMKFGLDHVPDTDEWVLTVDCHDRKLLDAAGDEERAAVADLIDRNARIKSAIERRWTDAGLPTFERFVRRRLKERGTGGDRSGEGGD